MDQVDIFEMAYTMYVIRVKDAPKDVELNKWINDTLEYVLNKFKDMIQDVTQLERYLNTRISREREEEEPAILLGEEAGDSTWWIDYKNNFENAAKLDFWNRYNTYLAVEKKWEKSAIKKSIDNTTDRLLNSIANPRAMVEEEKRAMVVGYVQSGKTANYIGLINKALDAGYKYIIVLAGMHNNLRSQTQSRIDEEVLGYETNSVAKQKQRETAQRTLYF